MSLRIAGKDNVFSQVSTRWLIDRPRVQMNGLSIAGLGSERLLDWMEGNARFQVQAVRLATATSAPGLQDLLNQLTLSTGRQSGDIQLADETDAIWLMDVGGGVLPLQFDIAWDCPGHGPEFSRYALHAALPDPGEDARRNVLTDLVGRISCDASRYSSPSADS
jgi:hypothetical protein